MSNEIWRRIQDIQRQDADELRLASEKRQRAQLERESQRSAEEEARRAQEEIWQRQMDALAKERDLVLEDAVSRVSGVYSGVADGAPAIRSSEVSRVLVYGMNPTFVALQWGSKFELTPGERKFIEENTYRRRFSKKPVGQIIGGWFYEIKTSIDVIDPVSSPEQWLGESRVNVLQGDQEVPVETLLSDSEVILRGVARQIEHPTFIQEVYRRGLDYWKPVQGFLAAHYNKVAVRKMFERSGNGPYSDNNGGPGMGI